MADDPEFNYTNEDIRTGDDYGGMVRAVMPGYWFRTGDEPGQRHSLMLMFDDAPWMELDTLPDFIRWLRGVHERAKRMEREMDEEGLT